MWKHNYYGQFLAFVSKFHQNRIKSSRFDTFRSFVTCLWLFVVSFGIIITFSLFFTLLFLLFSSSVLVHCFGEAADSEVFEGVVGSSFYQKRSCFSSTFGPEREAKRQKSIVIETPANSGWG